MKHRILVVLLISSLVFLLAVHGARRGHNRRKSYRNKLKNGTFDLFIFTQHWPATVCYTWKGKSSGHSCSFPKDNQEWGIHGIWPTKFGQKGPEHCIRMPFKYNDIIPIENELKQKWIDVENGTKHYSFWQHEWEKHGTCSANITEVNTEYKYFKKGLELFDKYDMKHVLAKVSILPGQTYPLEAYFDGVTKILGRHPQIECIRNKETKEEYIQEIRICFDKHFNIKDCNGVAGYPTNCKHNNSIIYPGITPGAISVIQI